MATVLYDQDDFGRGMQQFSNATRGIAEDILYGQEAPILKQMLASYGSGINSQQDLAQAMAMMGTPIRSERLQNEILSWARYLPPTTPEIKTEKWSRRVIDEEGNVWFEQAAFPKEWGAEKIKEQWKTGNKKLTYDDPVQGDPSTYARKKEEPEDKYITGTKLKESQVYTETRVAQSQIDTLLSTLSEVDVALKPHILQAIQNRHEIIHMNNQLLLGEIDAKEWLKQRSVISARGVKVFEGADTIAAPGAGGGTAGPPPPSTKTWDFESMNRQELKDITPNQVRQMSREENEKLRKALLREGL